MSDYTACAYKITDLNETVIKCLEFIGANKLIKPDTRIFIKPNFTFPYFKQGITTNPELLKMVLRYLREFSSRIIVGESDGGNSSFTANDAFRGHDLVDICKALDVKLVNLSQVDSVMIQEEIVDKKVAVELPRLLIDDVDCFISMPVLKVHVMTTVTLSIKNLWGCYPDTMRCLHHKHLGHKLALITKYVKPKLVIVDGICALDGHGPMFGTAKQLDLILGSNNPVVADALGSTIMGFNPRSVQHLRIAEEAGLGTLDLSQVILNEDCTNFQYKFSVKKTIIDRLSVLLFENEGLARLVMQSPLTPMIYGVASCLRTSQEKEVNRQMKG